MALLRTWAPAWLHDFGYGRQLVDTGFHPVDGARFLRRIGATDLEPSLVAHHSGATFGWERGLVSELREFEPPPAELLDALVLVDMTTSRVSRSSRACWTRRRIDGCRSSSWSRSG